MMISVAVALMTTWLGLFVAFYEPYPVSFFITSIVFVFYLLARLSNRIMKSRSAYGAISEA
jgi:zinc/manganese transport system permease protein